MGNAEQAPFGFYFLQAAQEEPAKAPILFDASEDRLDINGALFAQSDTLLGQQLFLGLGTHLPQAEAYLDLAIALGFGALLLEGALAAIIADIHPALALKAILALVVMGGFVA